LETTIKPITDEHWNKKSNNNNKNNNKETRYTVVCAELHFKIYNETGVKLDKKTGLTMYQNQSKQVMMVRLPYWGANMYEMTELFLTINWTSKSAIIKK
jgi:hypothetical protein